MMDNAGSFSGKQVVLSPVKGGRWAFFGRHIYQTTIIERFAREGLQPPVVVVDPDETYERDKRLLSEHGLFCDLEKYAADGLIEKHVMPTVNCDECIDLLKDKNCVAGLSIACRSIFKQPIIDFFGGHLFNLHDSFLPEERGGALNTWRILNGIQTAGATIHVLERGIDTGDILFRIKKDVAGARPKPVDYDRAQVECATVILEQFADALIADTPIASVAQNNDESIYLPRLYTEVNGALDTAQSPGEFERFVRAFSDPYPGAFTFFRDQRIHILDCEIIEETGYHPFCNGRIVTQRDDGSVNVVIGGGMIRVTRITVDGEQKRPADVLSIRNILHTPADVLEQARLTIPDVKVMI